MAERHFLVVSEDPSMKHEVELTLEDLQTMDLIPCGSFDVGNISKTYWIVRPAMLNV
jgi:hypothetical protein